MATSMLIFSINSVLVTIHELQKAEIKISRLQQEASDPSTKIQNANVATVQQL